MRPRSRRYFSRARKVTEKCGVRVVCIIYCPTCETQATTGAYKCYSEELCCACETRQLPKLQQWCVIASSSSICSRYCNKTFLQNAPCGYGSDLLFCGRSLKILLKNDFVNALKFAKIDLRNISASQYVPLYSW